MVVLIAALAAPASLPAPDMVGAVEQSTVSFARRSDSGAEATARVTVRIIAHSARIGSAYSAPQALMVPRTTAVAAADGTMVPALVYDFE